MWKIVSTHPDHDQSVSMSFSSRSTALSVSAEWAEQGYSVLLTFTPKVKK